MDAINEAKNEVREVIAEWVLSSPSEALITAVLEQDDFIIPEVMKWGATDTVVREKIMQAVAQVVAGRSWPEGQDGEEAMEAFERDFDSKSSAWQD